MIQIGIIHAHPIYSHGLALLLEDSVNNLQVAGVDRDLRTLMDHFYGDSLDIIIWDIPNHHVLTPGIRVLKNRFPLAKIIVLVSNSNPVYAGLLETLGASAVLTASCKIDQLIDTINKIHESYNPHPSSNHVQEPPAGDKQPSLDGLETTVLQLIAEGSSINDIALKLGLGRDKISKCRRGLKRKLQAKDRSTLIKKAVDYRLIETNNNQSAS